MTDAREPDRNPPVEAISRRYAALRRRDTAAELRIRRALHQQGLRFRVHARIDGLPRRRVDIAFTRWKVVVQVDGCFWHGCPQHSRVPQTNSDWWQWKISNTIRRDRDTDRQLASLGWKVARFWEHEDVSAVVARVMAVLGEVGWAPGRPE